MQIVRRVAVVTGRVQGVSFRWYTQIEADRRSLSGWVRNEPDGSVRVEVQGPDEDVTGFVRWLRMGSPAAVVDHVQVSDIDPVARETDFRVTA